VCVVESSNHKVDGKGVTSKNVYEKMDVQFNLVSPK